MFSVRILWVVGGALALCGCAPEPPRRAFSQLAEEFVYRTLASSPVAATQVGYHQHAGVRLDAVLDDYSPSAIEKQRHWYESVRLQLARSIKPADLSADDRADYDIIQDQIALALLEITTVQNYRHNPTLYVELIGNGLYAPYVLEYAPKEQRYEHIIGRLRGVPALLSQARRNLASAPEIWTKVAQEENTGNLELIDRTLRAECPPSLRARFDEAASTALTGLRGFSEWLSTDLSGHTRDWRLGRDKYGQKFRYVLATDQTPDQVLRAAEEAMRETRAEMLAIARKLGYADIRAALASVSQKHSTPETYFSDARRDLEEARAFVREKNLLTLPPRDNLKVIETPEFMRGIYAVGGFNPAPALEPQLGAFYWLTPIPSGWPADRIESKLREYNYYGLKLLTIHEAMPGHYVQLEYANDVQPALRRIVRAVFGNGAYIEGWAVYATEMMLDQGYLGGDPALRLTFLKQQLRVFANAILDVRLQTMGMTDEEAIRLMLDQAFQEREEAVAKLQRAKLSSAQLPTYFVGWRDWRRLRERFGSLPLREFHERALTAGAVPLPVLNRLLAR